MHTATADAHALRALVLTATGRDNALYCASLGAARILAEPCADVPALCRKLREGVGVVIAAEEALRSGLDLLLRELETEPAWSDLPLLVITASRGEEAGPCVSALGTRANVMLLEPPVGTGTLTTAAQFALRARRRQLQVEGELFQRKRAAGTLVESELRFRTTFENAAVGLAHVGLDHRFINVNQRLCSIVGYSSDELIGRSFADITHPDDLPADLAFVERLFRGEIARYSMEKRYAHAAGHFVWVNLTVALQRDEAGAPSYYIVVVEDIADRKRIEEELHDAKVAAEEANRAKDHFLAVLSHELRTPLTPVLAQVSALERQPGLEPDTREVLEMIRRNVELEARLIDDLLDVTRIARGKVELTRRRAPLCEIIRCAVEVCRPDIDARELDFVLDLGHETPYIVEADVGRLQQVFWNLLKNAIKFTPRGGRVAVRCRRLEDHSILAEVADTGIGIEPEALPRLFNAFEQAERSITRQFGGLGLGLTISKALVEMHGGTIEARSAGRGKGASFSVRLPLSSWLAASAPAAPERRPELSSEAQPGSTASLRILLVEDHDDTAEILRQLLAAEGHEVNVATSVASALELTGRRRFDLLISDLGLPDRSGADLMQELRSRGETLPGIALSGYGREEDLQRSRQVGFFLHLVKPITVEHLLAALASILAGNAVARS